MLSLQEWLKIVKHWIHQGEWQKVRVSARKRRQARERGKAYPICG